MARVDYGIFKCRLHNLCQLRNVMYVIRTAASIKV